MLPIYTFGSIWLFVNVHKLRIFSYSRCLSRFEQGSYDTGFKAQMFSI